jgi:hypothetical protein
MENEDEIKKITNDVSIKELAALALAIFNLIQLRTSSKSEELDSSDIKVLSEVVGLLENLKSSLPLEKIVIEEASKPKAIQFIDSVSLNNISKLIQGIDNIPNTMGIVEDKNDPSRLEYLPKEKSFYQIINVTKMPVGEAKVYRELTTDTKTIVAAAEKATHDAYLKAREQKLSMVLQEDDNLIEIDENGVKKILYKIERPDVQLPLKFKLK